MKHTSLAVLFLLAAPVLASNPGEPLDCSDWVFVEPGYSCQVLVPPNCSGNDNPFCDRPGTGINVDNDNRRFGGRAHITGSCGTDETHRIELVVFTPTTETVIGYYESRCVAPGGGIMGPPVLDKAQVSPIGSFEPTTGRFVMSWRAYSQGGNLYPDTFSVLAIDGFTTLFDVLQTFTPTADTISFRTPYMPEGFQFADFFDTYTGNLATVGDWSQLQPLACGYPATAPNVGDYLTVADTLADPAPGTGRYYLTVANFMGQRRFGRKNIGGVLSGRDPAALPACP